VSGVALLLLAGAGAGGGGGSTPAMAWANISGDTAAVSNTQTASMAGTIMVGATLSALGALHFIKNGTIAAFSGDFPLGNGDTLAWEVTNLSGTANVAGTVTVSDDTNGAAIDSFTYFVRPPA
jgi:hypothetical protein